jgi:hypothetical protein
MILEKTNNHESLIILVQQVLSDLYKGRPWIINRLDDAFRKVLGWEENDKFSHATNNDD